MAENRYYVIRKAGARKYVMCSERYSGPPEEWAKQGGTHLVGVYTDPFDAREKVAEMNRRLKDVRRAERLEA